MTISMISAKAQNNTIGLNNDLVWQLPDDLKRFKAITLGHPVIMGRKSYEGIGHPLPKRTNIVISRNAAFVAEGCVVVQSLEAALAEAKITGNDEIFIIGGAEIYNLGMAVADKLYITEVMGDFKGDAFFPEIDLKIWRETFREHHPTDEKHATAFDFVNFERR